MLARADFCYDERMYNEKQKIYAKQRYAQKREMFVAYQIAYYLKNKDKINARKRELRAIKNANKPPKSKKIYPKGQLYKLLRKEAVLERNNRCEECGFYNENPSFFDFDHIIPLRKSRNRSRYHLIKSLWANPPEVKMLCPNCHRIKTIKDGWR